MFETFLLVDFENVRALDLAQVPPRWHVRIFIGRSQNTIPFTLANEAQKFGPRLEWIKIEGDGKNNLDFHLAYYMGLLAKGHSSASFLILSRDKGFDALIAHVVRTGTPCKRIESLASDEPIAAPDPPPAGSPYFARARAVLAKLDKKNRPRKRQTLAQYLSSLLPREKRLVTVISELIEEFIRQELITELNQVLTYHF